MILRTFLFGFLLFSTAMAQSLQTPYERGNGNQTATYEEAIQFARTLADASPRIQVLEYGTTDIGKPLHLIVYSQSGEFDPARLKDQGKVIWLINNGIHPGEPDGIDASLMLMRDFIRQKSLRRLLDNVVVAVIPVYNVDGALNRGSYSRANQNGPEAYGFRGNARNLDLNRDFIKTDSRNARTFHEIYHAWQPDVYLENHVSNGADYPYVMTYIATQKDKLGGAMGQYLDEVFEPDLNRSMTDRGFPLTPYVNHFGPGPVDQIVQFPDLPRYSTGYTALFGTLSFMTESHMLKPYAQRVTGTYEYMVATLELVHRDARRIRQIRQETDARVQQQSEFALRWEPDTSQYRPLRFQGYVGEMVTSRISGLPRLTYDRNRPYEDTIPFYNYYVPSVMVQKPYAYVIPQAWWDVVERLERNQIRLQRFERDTTLAVDVYYLDAFETLPRPFEGHYLHHNTEVRTETQTLPVYAGDYLLVLDQPGNRFAVETLEPQGPDSFFSWNFFDSVLQQKEGFSDYVFEEIAEQLLADDPALRRAYEAKKEADAAFAQDHRAQLDFFYRASPYFEPSYRRYPVYRLLHP
ncbi:Zinc carboxypeptidase [Catalinimonas alkaloidigena]|uniref:Zinc carboxypeptidase n=1 Tax=Catalinimonas alkaloidigena TaxID=1075417 RepID=A0A1G9DLZ6_9BACT|nr:M14 family zinc carboxypeptidase [Catalinimonas alkaloidigena]SDK64765.1 Zinc carboxypeptidase [Catalinimonas alkaloidigena]